ncbi:MAG: SUF system Fe-S cluster assembly regulator [Legionellaceae bacterium]|nr:SUF system Fe-S cluster assembly regulator [Legionellaceae bacterium]
MLRISKMADYATLIMSYLARIYPAQASARDIALHTHIARPTVSKLLKLLSMEALLHSVRGVQGGYTLHCDPKEISLAQIVYALDSSRGLTVCHHQPESCALQSVCTVQGNWKLISRAIETALDSITLDALAKPVLEPQDLSAMQASLEKIYS